MKKLFIFLLAILCILPAWAETEIAGYIDENIGLYHVEDTRTPVRLKNRGFEIALLSTVESSQNLSVSNSFFTGMDLLQKTAVIDFRDLDKGLQAELGVNLTIAAININWKDKWGFGFDLGNITAYANIDIPKKLLQFQQTKKEYFGVGGAAYFDIGLPIFFHILKLKMKLRPAAYIPIAYAEPNISYTFTEKGNGLYMGLAYDLYVYSVLDMENILGSDSFDFMALLGLLNTTTIGFDFNIGFEFPVIPQLDVGVNILNIPVKPSQIKHYMRLTGEAYVDTSKIDIMEMMNGGEMPDDIYSFPDNFDIVYGTSEKSVIRPIKFIVHTNYRPFKHPMLTLIPNVGMSLNSMYAEPVSLEAGLKLRLDFANMFVTTFGINYEDRVWKNTMLLTLNLRIFQIDVGIGIGSQDFKKSFRIAGASANIGFKFGW